MIIAIYGYFDGMKHLKRMDNVSSVQRRAYTKLLARLSSYKMVPKTQCHGL